MYNSINKCEVQQFSDISVARGLGGHDPPQIFRTYSLLCFERRYPKQNWCHSPKINHVGSPKIFVLATLLLSDKDPLVLIPTRTSCLYIKSETANDVLAEQNTSKGQKGVTN